jgi:hypothetical protein
VDPSKGLVGQTSREVLHDDAAGLGTGASGKELRGKRQHGVVRSRFLPDAKAIEHGLALSSEQVPAALLGKRAGRVTESALLRGGHGRLLGDKEGALVSPHALLQAFAKRGCVVYPAFPRDPSSDERQAF